MATRHSATIIAQQDETKANSGIQSNSILQRRKSLFKWQPCPKNADQCRGNGAESPPVQRKNSDGISLQGLPTRLITQRCLENLHPSFLMSKRKLF